ncbi:hypothetical protein HOC13_01605 [Candidatus Woesearchaeota archaeon]|nr:hypothetical protein [Candidatus Woesearchaeota archaeon]
MTKKQTKKVTKKTTKKEEPKAGVPAQAQQKLPPELEKKLKELKSKLDKFKKNVTEKFGEYIMGITLLPPEKQPQEKDKTPEKKGEEEKKIRLMVLVDDSTSQKMSKEELKEKLAVIIEKMGKEIDPNINAQTVILSELWQNCYDAKYDLLRAIAMGAPVFDKGMLQAIKISEIHKSMILKKFEKYIVSYVLAGSLTQGRATETSDIDVWIVIDDTDVKKMTRVELKDKLRAIIIGMGIEAGEMTGIKNKLNIQVYILTDFWDSLREANPVIFTLLRDGVPFHDKGTFMPWKLMLKMGKIKPSREAIDIFMSTGEQMIKRVKHKLKEIGMEDVYYSILTPSQAALMLYGIPPPTPRETPEVMNNIFVKKEKLLEPEYIKILETNVQLRKEIEHGTKKELSGKEVDKLLGDAEKYLKRIDRLFKQIEKSHEELSVVKLYDEVITIIRDVLRLEGIERAKDEDIVKIFENELISTGKVPSRYLRDLNEIIEAKKDFDKGKLTKSEIEKTRKNSGPLIKFLIEHMQRKRGRELERAKIKIKHGEKYGEVYMLDTEAFIIHDIDAKEQRVERAPINSDGSLGPSEESSLEEFEKALAKIKFPQRVFIKAPVFEDLKGIFGKDIEVLLSY